MEPGPPPLKPPGHVGSSPNLGFGQDSNLAKTHRLPTEITHLVAGLNEAQVLDVSSQKEFS